MTKLVLVLWGRVGKKVIKQGNAATNNRKKNNQPTKYNVSNGWHRHRIERGAKAGPSHHVLTMKHHMLFIRSLSFKEDRPTTVTIPESLVFRYAHAGPPAANLANTPGLRLAQLFFWQHCNTINILAARRWSRETSSHV